MSRLIPGRSGRQNKSNLTTDLEVSFTYGKDPLTWLKKLVSRKKGSPLRKQRNYLGSSVIMEREGITDDEPSATTGDNIKRMIKLLKLMLNKK